MPLFNAMDVQVLFVDDVERSAAFYRDSLEFDLAFSDDESAGFNLDNLMLILLDHKNASAQLGGAPTARPQATGPSVQLCAFVDDVDAVHSQLVQKGVHIIEGPKDQEWGRRTAFFSDPDGHVWEISKEIAAT